MIVLTVIDQKSMGKYTIDMSSQGHTFISLVVAFLLVSRVNIAMDRYHQARRCLEDMYQQCREIVQHACLFSSESTNEPSREWRYELGYRCLILLRTSMAVIDYPVTKLPAWEVPELDGFEKYDIQNATETRRWAHAKRNTSEESMRVPIRAAYLLRKTIHSHDKRVQKPLHITQENMLLSHVDGFMGGYYGIRRLLTTPVPFPLIQMARTFLFLYVFTVPFVMLGDESSLVAHCFAVFVITYGFVGLELVALELDNPFGEGANDFNNGYVGTFWASFWTLMHYQVILTIHIFDCTELWR
jgi:predicted membrane chloride channel (bestrophin family)